VIRALVTGVGAVIGYGVLRCLRDAGAPVETVGVDIHADAVGRRFADAFEVAPPTADPGWEDWLAAVVRRRGVDLVIPGIEQDALRLAEAAEAGRRQPCAVALNRPEVVRLCWDKGALDARLRALGEPSRIPTETTGGFDDLADRLGAPFLLKPRRSYAGKGIVRVADAAAFAPHAARLGAELLAQRIVGTDEEEYTVSVFCDADGAPRTGMALRRRLSPEGATRWAETVPMDPFAPVVARLCAALRPEGPTNFQFRMERGAPMLLEINPRISSATSIRAAFGLNEAALCVEHYALRRPIVPPQLRTGRAERYIADIVDIDHDDRADL
jgi:carbamoyl-phosphate synthase large subunit